MMADTRDPRIDLSGVKLDTPSDYSDFVGRVLVFVDLSVTPLEGDAAARVMNSVVRAIMSKVDQTTPNGKLMMTMVTDIITKGSDADQQAWHDHAPASVEGDILQVEAPMSGSRRVHAASVHKTPSWRDEARALDDSCFQGHAVAEDAFFGVSPLVMKSRAPHIPVNLFDDGGDLVIDLDQTPEPVALMSKSMLKGREEKECDCAPWAFRSVEGQ